jgi:putative oxygen-independent coproporphyrinogen III oxidase
MTRYTDAYFDALQREIAAFRRVHRERADTVFFGGGTPSFVASAHIRGVLRALGLGAAQNPARECTIEANPGTLNRDKLADYRDMGVNRLSVGIQSTHEKYLKMLGRVHSFADCRRNLADAGNVGFDNISADLIFGLPGQTMDEWEQTLEAVLNLGVRHLSCYSLSLEEGTALWDAVARGELPEPDEGVDRALYHFAVDYLKSAGLLQYELSNFAAPGRACRHNLKYWTGAPYRGFGAGAASYYRTVRFTNVAGIPAYIRRMGGPPGPRPAAAADLAASADMGANARGSGGGDLAAGADMGANARSSGDADLGANARNSGDGDLAAIAERVAIDAAEREKEYIILRLRLAAGLDADAFRRAFGRDFLKKYQTAVQKLRAEGLLELRRQRRPDGRRRVRAVLTPKGMDLANRVFVEFI